ncbi:hypothetical protein NMR80_001364 [Vibrio cholerae]|nr:hypothetical protein [Vibrio cholerae]
MNMQQEIQIQELANYYINKPYVLAHSDCNIITLHFLKLLAGVPLYDQMLGRYATVTGGIRVAKKLTGHDTPLLVLLHADYSKPVPLQHITTGDIIVVQNNNHYGCMVCLGDRLLCSDAKAGISACAVDIDWLVENQAKAFRVTK